MPCCEFDVLRWPKILFRRRFTQQFGGGLILFRGDPSGIGHDTGRLENHYRYGLGVTLHPVT
jgi:hypothetical protein